MSLGRTWIQVNTSYNVLGCCWCTPRVWRWYPRFHSQLNPSIPDGSGLPAVKVQALKRQSERFVLTSRLDGLALGQKKWYVLWMYMHKWHAFHFIRCCFDYNELDSKHAIKYHKISILYYFVVSQTTCNLSPFFKSHIYINLQVMWLLQMPTRQLRELIGIFESPAHRIELCVIFFNRIVVRLDGWEDNGWCEGSMIRFDCDGVKLLRME